MNHTTMHHPVPRRSSGFNPIRRWTLALLLLVPAFHLNAEPRHYTIDPDHFAIQFGINHLGYETVLGFFLDAQGEFQYDAEAGTVPSGKVTVATKSVFTNHDERDHHVRSSDFLSADDFPTIVYQVTGFEKTGDNTGKLMGNLTLRGQTHPVTLDVTLNKAAVYPFGHKSYTLGLSARTTIRRSDWGMTYALDPLLVGDEVDLRFELEAIQD